MENATIKLSGHALSFYSEKLHEYCTRRDISPKDVTLEDRGAGEYTWVRTSLPTYKETVVLDSDKIHEEAWTQEDSELFTILCDIDHHDETIDRVYEALSQEDPMVDEALVFDYEQDRERLMMVKEKMEEARGRGVSKEESPASTYLKHVEMVQKRPVFSDSQVSWEASPSPW